MNYSISLTKRTIRKGGSQHAEKQMGATGKRPGAATGGKGEGTGMNAVIRILTQVGQYVYKNSVWLIPIMDTAIRTIKKLIKKGKDERAVKRENQNRSGEAGQDSGLRQDCQQGPE